MSLPQKLGKQMPKQPLNINNFSGGLNNHADPRDIADNELAAARDVNVSHNGQISIVGAFADASWIFPDYGGNAMHGYAPGGRGLFHFASDYVDGENGTGETGALSDTDYLLATDNTDGTVHCYSSVTSLWGTNTIMDIGTDVHPSFYAHRGAVRLADAKHQSGSEARWYGHTTTTFAGLTSLGATVNQWLLNYQYLAAPVAGSKSDTSFNLGNGEVGIARFENSYSATIQTNQTAGNPALTTGDGIASGLLKIQYSGSSGDGGWSQAGSGVPGIRFFASYDYGHLGEGPLSEITDGMDVLISSGLTITDKELSCALLIHVFDKWVDYRIQGLKIYFSLPDDTYSLIDQEKYLLLDGNFNLGVRVAGTSDYQPWIHDAKDPYEYLFREFVIKDPPLVDTYESETGYSASEITASGGAGAAGNTPGEAGGTATMVKTSWGSACVANGRVYIGNVHQNGVSYPDSIFVSPAGKSDVFPLSSEIKITGNDGDTIVHLEEFADRILQFKKHKLQILNISQDIEFVEGIFEFKGVENPGSVCKIDMGVAWANRYGCYFYDGKQVHNLLEREGQKLISKSEWEDFVLGGGTDTSWDGQPQLGYLPLDRKLIVVDSGKHLSSGDAEGTFNGKLYIYDFVQRSWTNTDSAHAKSSAAPAFDTSSSVTSMSNFVTWPDGKLIHAMSVSPLNADLIPAPEGTFESAITEADQDDGWIDDDVGGHGAQNCSLSRYGTDQAYAGSYSGQCDLDATTGYISYKRTDYDTSKTYYASVWYKKGDDQVITSFQLFADTAIRGVDEWASTEYTTAAGSLTEGYKQAIVHFTPTNATMYLNFKIVGTSGHHMFIDKFSVHEDGGTGGRIEYWNEPYGSSGFLFRTKDYDFGSPGVRKKIYRVYITYKSTGASNARVLIEPDGHHEGAAGTGQESLYVGGDDITVNLPTTVDSNSKTVWNTVSVEPLSTDTDLNSIYSAAVIVKPIDGPGIIPSSFEINDITIVYRLKTVT